MKKILYLLFIFIAIPAFLYFALDRENIDINEFRLNSGYEEVKLSDGITSFLGKTYRNESQNSSQIKHDMAKLCE